MYYKTLEGKLTFCIHNWSCSSENIGERTVSKYFMINWYGITERTLPTVHIIRTFSLDFKTFPFKASCKKDREDKLKFSTAA